MQKNTDYKTADKLNPIFQQHMPLGRVQLHDLAFFKRKYAFIQQSKQLAASAKKK